VQKNCIEPYKGENMTNNIKDKEKLSFLQLLAKGRFAEAEILLSNNPQLKSVLLHLPGLRHTRFFKERIRFYKNYARQNKMASTLRGDDRDQLRDAFAQSHCKTRALKKACSDLLDSYDVAAFTTKISRIRFNQMLRRRRQRTNRL
jgi:hypothetical protein